MLQDNENYRRRLGRGISALLGGGPQAAEAIASGADAQLELRHVGVEQIERSPFQPRQDFDADSLNELAASIREHGVLQPLLVRELDGGFQLVAGERRWQAAKSAGLATVPCRVIDVIDKTACELALEENLKRKDLNDLEKAHAFRRYIDHFQCTVDELAKQLSMSRSTVSNILRLLDLPEPIQHAVQSGKISAGHARALLSLENLAQQLELCGRIQAEGLNVRQTEAAAKELCSRPNQRRRGSRGFRRAGSGRGRDDSAAGGARRDCRRRADQPRPVAGGTVGELAGGESRNPAENEGFRGNRGAVYVECRVRADFGAAAAGGSVMVESGVRKAERRQRPCLSTMDHRPSTLKKSLTVDFGPP
ncbi:MAG: ParB/RepB/Spo0J family partition protein [Planctomycetaceae bacterium]